jgi:ABC-type transport system substrate-binding protein
MSQLFRQIRFYIRLLWAFVAKYYALILLGIISGVISFLTFPYLVKLIPKFRPTIKIAVVGRYTTADIPKSIQQQISIGLTSISPEGLVGPGLASNWNVSEDGRVYTFNLSTNLLWQDGSKIKSRDLGFRFKDVEVEYPNDNQVVIKLKEPFSPLPAALSQPVFKSGLLGLGKYKAYRIKRNGQYIEELLLVPIDREISIPKIQYRFYASDSLAQMAFKLGLVDILENTLVTDEIASWPNVTVSEVVHKDRYVGVFFNNSKLDKSTRQALAYGIDKSRWKNRSLGPISDQSWAFNPDVKYYEFDLAKAGSKKPSEITLTTFPVFAKIASDIKSDWEKVGIKVNLSVVDSMPEDFTALLLAQATPVDPDQYALWHSTQSTNLTHYNSPRIDKLLEEGRKAKDRLNIYLDMQKYLLEDAPVAFLFYQTTYTIVRK